MKNLPPRQMRRERQVSNVAARSPAPDCDSSLFCVCCGEPLFRRTKHHIPLQTFRRNVCKIIVLQAGHRRSGLVRSASKAVAFLTHLLRAPKSKGAGSFAVCGQRLRGHVPLRTPRQLRSAGAAFSGQQFWNHFVPARCFLYSLIGRSVSARCVPKQKRTRRTVSLLRIEPRKTKKRPKAYASEHLNLVTRTGIEPMIPP